MSTTYEDIIREQAILEMRDEVIMKTATLAQRIYLFVEGYSEEKAIPILLERCDIDMEKLGIIIANYSGIGNLKHFLKILGKTLNHDRPIIVTYDNDEAGKTVPSQISKMFKNKQLVSLVCVPYKPVIQYSSGHCGGTYEESFEFNDFITACFTEGIINHDLLNFKNEFKQKFDVTKPWYPQIINFCKEKNKTEYVVDKVKLAVELAENSNTIPETYKYLAEKLIDVRKKHPVKHPEDVELTPIKGLTC